jgi:hypothetical protein
MPSPFVGCTNIAILAHCDAVGRGHPLHHLSTCSDSPSQLSHLSEFGIIAAKGIGRVDQLLELAESDSTLPNAARAVVQVPAQQLDGLDKSINDLEDEIVGPLDRVPMRGVASLA